MSRFGSGGTNGGQRGTVGIGVDPAFGRNPRDSALSPQQDAVELPADSINGPQTQQPQSFPSVPGIRSASAITSAMPPAYAESAGRTETSLGAGQQLSPNEKGVISQDPELSDPEISDDDDDSLLSVGDEGDWELDDLEELDGVADARDTSGLPTYEQSEATSQRETADDLVRHVVETSRVQIQAEEARSQGGSQARRQLPCPVILPQRHPRKKQRGFVRAYAPVLADCGIDQDTFMAFLKNLHKSSQTLVESFPVVQVSAACASFAPPVVAIAITAIVQVAAISREEVRNPFRTNDFLDRVNEELFRPSRLYAMLVKYKSDANNEQAATGSLSDLIQAQKVQVATNTIVAKYVQSTSKTSAAAMHNTGEQLQSLYSTEDIRQGTVAAPLIFPDLDKRLAHDGPESFKDKTKSVAYYLGRKAQIQNAQQDPNFAGESQRGLEPSFDSSDHRRRPPQVSSGKLDLRHDKRERKRERRLEKDVRRFERGREPKEGRRARRYGEGYVDDLHARINERLADSQSQPTIRRRDEASSAHDERDDPSTAPTDRRRRGPMVRRTLREDALYLMVVNLPSDAELAKARDELGNLEPQWEYGRGYLNPNMN